MKVRFSPRKVAVAVAALLIVSLSLFLLHRARSPEAKRDDALQALTSKDAERLIRLADPEEITKLHLSPQGVRGVLQETIWKGAVPRPTGVTRVTRIPSDQSLWESHFSGTQSGTTRILIPVIDHPKLGWKLNLSMMLRSSCYWYAGNQDGPGLYRRLARLHGIGGLRQQDGEYVTLEVLEERAARVANQ